MKKVKNGDYVFWCETELEVWRAETLFTKEEGTIAWLKSELKPGDVFWDVGANIGLYSIVAAKLGAMVYAFEPHVGNAAALLRNVQANDVKNVRLISSPLSDKKSWNAFCYSSLIPGSSGSQLGHSRSESGEWFNPVAEEAKRTITLDELPDTFNWPSVIKIDVDGNELEILTGGYNVLRRLRTIQVEIRQQSAAAIHELLTAAGFHFASRHDTANGKKQLAAGVSPEAITHNAIFRRAAEA